MDCVWEISCDGCGDTHQSDIGDKKSTVWADLKAHGWKRRKQFLWCKTCVERGTYKANYIDWAQEKA